MRVRVPFFAVLSVALLVGGFLLGRFTAPAPVAPTEGEGLIADRDSEAGMPGDQSSPGPLLHPTQRGRAVELKVDPPQPPPPPPTVGTIEVEGEGEAARVRVKGGALKVVSRRAGAYHLVRDGPWTTWHENGVKASEATYLGGVLDGAFASWHDDGTTHVQATYAKGRFIGPYVSFHKNGARQAESEYREGAQVGLYRSWHPNGQLQHEFTFRSGKAHGPVRTWHANGQLALSGSQEMGRKDGVWTTWDDNGVRRSESHWRLGVQEGAVLLWDANGEELAADGAEERATVAGKYSRLLKTIPAPHDYAHYKDFRDYGWYNATSSYAGVKDIPEGYWVYAYPNWYVWAEAKGVTRR